ALRAREGDARRRVSQALRRRATASFTRSSSAVQGDPFEALSAESRKLGQLEKALLALAPGFETEGLREQLLEPLGAAHARRVLGAVQFGRVEQLARSIGAVVESLRREGISAHRVLSESRELI